MGKSARLVLLALLLSTAAHAEVPIPPWTKYVVDLTNSLKPEQLTVLNERLADLEASKGAQFGVLIVPTTQPEDVFQFGMRVVETWKPGRKGVDDGMLWVIAADTGKWHILTGYGLEGALPDVKIKHIADEFITPHFKRDEGYAGIEAGLNEMIKIIAKEPLPLPQGRSSMWYASVRPQDVIPIPPWTQPIIDLTGTFDPERVKALNKRLKDFEYRKGAQIGLLVVPTTRTESGEKFLERVCETWALGRDGIDDGVIMTMSLDDKQFHIIPGIGLQKDLDRPRLAGIMNEIIVPNLMLNEYENGIEAGVEELVKVIDDIPLPPPDHSWKSSVGNWLTTSWKSIVYFIENYYGALIPAALLGMVMLYRYARRLKSSENVTG